MDGLGIPAVPVIYADDVGSVEVIGNRVRIVYVEFRRVEGEVVSVPVLEMIRPIESVGCGKLLAMVQAAVAEIKEAAAAILVRH